MSKRTLIRGGWVVGYAGNTHTLLRDGVVVYEDGRILFVGLQFTDRVDKEIDARGKLVAPGFIDTDMTRVLAEEQRDGMLAQVPLGRLGEGDDIANAVVFLASGAGAYITGETLHVNGGMLMD